MRRRARCVAGGVLIVAVLGVGGPAPAAHAATGDLLVSESNASGGNEVLVYRVNADGSVTPGPSIPTGHPGTGSYVHTAHAVASLTSERVLAVNAGDGSVSVLDRNGDSMQQVSTFGSAGTTPVSIATHGGAIAYVLNSGMPIATDKPKSRRIAAPVIQGFRISADGSATRISGARFRLPDDCTGYPCNSAVVYGGISLSPDGHSLVLSESSLNQLRTIAVNDDGSLGASTLTATRIVGPYGSVFTRRGLLVVSGHTLPSVQGAVATGVLRRGQLVPVQTQVPVAFSNSCWVTAAPDGSLIYTSDAGFEKRSQRIGITSFKVGPGGRLTRIGSTLLPWDKIEFPNDGVVAPDGAHLYVKSLQGVYSFDIDENGVASYAPAMSLTNAPKTEGPMGLVIVPGT